MANSLFRKFIFACSCQLLRLILGFLMWSIAALIFSPFILGFCVLVSTFVKIPIPEWLVIPIGLIIGLYQIMVGFGLIGLMIECGNARAPYSKWDTISGWFEKIPSFIGVMKSD